MTLDIESFPSKKSKQVFKIFKKILQERSIKWTLFVRKKKKRIYLDILTTVFLGMSEVVLINVGWQWPLGLLADPSVRRLERRWFLPPGTRGTLAEGTAGRAEPSRAHRFAQMMTGRGAGRRMSVVIGVRGWPPVDYVHVPSWRRRLGRALTPRPFLLLLACWFWVRWAHVGRGVPHRALLQRQHRPLAHPARWVHLRVPRVVAASRRPGAKRIPGRRVVHDGLHIASRTFPRLSLFRWPPPHLVHHLFALAATSFSSTHNIHTRGSQYRVFLRVRGIHGAHGLDLGGRLAFIRRHAMEGLVNRILDGGLESGGEVRRIVLG